MPILLIKHQYFNSKLCLYETLRIELFCTIAVFLSLYFGKNPEIISENIKDWVFGISFLSIFLQGGGPYFKTNHISQSTKSKSKKNPDTLKNWPLVKNPQFLSNPHETWSKWLTHEVIIFTKFHED